MNIGHAARIGVVLSSGGGRGVYAHTGFLLALRELGIEAGAIAIAIGVVIAAVCRTLQQALLLSFFGLFPIMFLSGTLAPIASMPAFLQRLSLGSPLRYYMDVILGIFLKGIGMAELWPQVLALVLIGTVLYALAAFIFQRNY